MKILFRLLLLMTALGLMLTGRVTAQTFRTLYSFTEGNDGGYPAGGLILSGTALYGTTRGGPGNGTVFAVHADGTSFTTLHNFTIPFPSGSLVSSGNTLYGTASEGGISGQGTVFAVNTDGTGFTTLHSFTAQDHNTGTNSDGAQPMAGLLLSSNTLYGTTYLGGSSGKGTVFKLNTDGSGFRSLYHFTGGGDGGGPSGLSLSGESLYGTTSGGGSPADATNIGGILGEGTVFKVNTDGSGFTSLHRFMPLSADSSGISTNGGGANPGGSLILSGTTLFGTALFGGCSGNGALFAVNTDGSGFTTLYEFSGYSEGSYPSAGLILSGNTLYGATQGGFVGDNWVYPHASNTLFAVNTNGSGFTTLYTFNALGLYPPISSGTEPTGGLILSGTTLYGTAQYGGSAGYGTVFSLSFQPQLTTIPSGSNLILSWPTSYAGFDYTGYTLQSTTNLASPVWTTNSAAPVVINGQNTVTNPISGTHQARLGLPRFNASRFLE